MFYNLAKQLCLIFFDAQKNPMKKVWTDLITLISQCEICSSGKENALPDATLSVLKTKSGFFSFLLFPLPQAIFGKRRVTRQSVSRKDSGCTFRNRGQNQKTIKSFGSELGRGSQQNWLLDMARPKGLLNSNPNGFSSKDLLWPLWFKHLEKFI